MQQSDNIQLKNFANITKHYFDGVQDCSVIDMNAALDHSKNLMLQQRIAALAKEKEQQEQQEQKRIV